MRGSGYVRGGKPYGASRGRGDQRYRGGRQGPREEGLWSFAVMDAQGFCSFYFLCFRCTRCYVHGPRRIRPYHDGPDNIAGDQLLVSANL